MRKIALLSLWAFRAFGQTPQDASPKLDVMLLVEESVLASNIAHMTKLTSLQPGDRIAVMTFSNKVSTKLPFTDDLAAADKAVRDLKGKRPDNTVRLWDEVTSAVGLFPQTATPDRKRVMVILFSKPDRSRTESGNTALGALQRAGISMSASAVGAPREPPRPRDEVIWHENLPRASTLRLPPSALQEIARVVQLTNGLMQEAKWDFAAIVDHAR